MRNRRPSDDMRDVEDELRVAKILARVREDARKMFELLDSQLQGVQQKLSDEAREKAQDNFDDFDNGDIDAVLRIAGRRLSGKPADDDEYRRFLDRIDGLGAGEAFARLQGLLGKPVARNPVTPPEPPRASETPPREPQSPQEAPARTQEKTQDAPQPHQAVERPSPAAEETEAGAVARQPAARAQEAARSRTSNERKPAERQEEKPPQPQRGVAPPLGNDKFVLHRVELREKDREKAEEIVASAYEAAQTTGRKGVVPGGTGKFAWRPQLYNNAFGDKLRELHEAKVAAEGGAAAKSAPERTEEISVPDAARPAAPEAEVEFEAPLEDALRPVTQVETSSSELAEEVREINATFDDEEVDPAYLETDADRYRDRPEPPPYNVHDNTIGFEDRDDDGGSEESFPEPDDMPEALRERAPTSPAQAPEHAEPAEQATTPPAPSQREPEKAPEAPVKPAAQPTVRPPQVRPPARPAQAPAKTSEQPAPAAAPASPVRPQAARPPARQPAAASTPSVPQSSSTETVRPAERPAPPVAPSAGQGAAASPARSSGPPPVLMPRRSGFLPTTPVALADISPEALARATPDNPAIKTRVDPPPVAAQTAPSIAPRAAAPMDEATEEEDPPRQIRRPKWLSQLRDEDPPD